MRACETRAAWEALPLVDVAAVTGGAPFLVLSPHPDDESLGTGGLIAASVAAGVPVHVAVLTDGAGSHPRSRRVPPAALVALRRRETAMAGAALGLRPDALTHLDLPDTRAPTQGPAFDEAVRRLLALADAAGARTVLTTWRHDPHCDHEAAAAMARAMRDADPGLALWAYPIWGWHLDDEAEVDEAMPTGVRVDVTGWLDAKRAAIAAHVSQMTTLIDDDPEGFRFTPALLAPFERHWEVLVKVPS